MFTMIIGSDLVPTDTNYDLFEAADIEALVGSELLYQLRNADFRVFNLETPITDTPAPIPKCGPNLITPTRTMPGIKAFNPSLLALANNHILDQGDDAMLETMKHLENFDIPYMGAGHNLEEALKPYIIEADNRKIGFYNCAEHEFTIAESDKAGANPFDPFESLDHISELKEKCDYVIVLYHGGKEHYRYPSPNLQKTCRKIVEKGADLVVCQHSHCVGCMEDYKGGKIVYGQGNFLFDHSNSEYWQTSLLIKLEFGDKVKISYIPIKKHDNMSRLADEKVSEEIMKGFYDRSDEILKPGKIESNFRNLCERDEQWYLYAISGGESNLGVSCEDFEPNYTKEGLLIMLNYLVCEPHREFLTDIVNKMLSEK